MFAHLPSVQRPLVRLFLPVTLLMVMSSSVLSSSPLLMAGEAVPLFEEDHIVKVSVARTPMLVESSVVALLNAGTEVTVRELRYPWVWVTHPTRRPPVNGWVPLTHIDFDLATWKGFGVVPGTDTNGEIVFLDLSGWKVHDPQLVSLTRMTSLRDLILPNQPMTDEAIRTIRRLRQLEVLVLPDEAISQEQLMTLLKLPKLTLLTIPGGSVSEMDVAALRESHPHLQVLP